MDTAPAAVRFETVSSIAAVPVLGPCDLHLWLMPLAVPEPAVTALASLLSRDEVERAARFHFPEHRRRHTVAHAVLRQLLSAYVGGRPERLSFSIGPKDKPSLAMPGAMSLHFNMAHSGDYALYGVAREELGVDLEVMRDSRDLLCIASRFFAANEYAALSALIDNEQRDAFYRVWTRKEAYIKARGTGLAEGLKSFEVPVGATEPPRLLRVGAAGERADDWSLIDVHPLAGVAGAVALRGHGWQVRAWSVTPPDGPASWAL